MTHTLLKKLARLAKDNPEMRPHLMPLIREASEDPAYSGNADGKPIYDHEIDHGYDEPLAGGTDVMRRLQNQFRKEQGTSERPASPVIPKQAASPRGRWEVAVAFGTDEQADAVFSDGKRQLERLGMRVADSESVDESTNIYYFEEPPDLGKLKRWVKGYARNMGLWYWAIRQGGRTVADWEMRAASVRSAYSVLAAGVFEFDEAAQGTGDKKLRRLARTAHALIDEIHRTLTGPQD